MANKAISELSPTEINAELNLWKHDKDGNRYVDYDKDQEAARQYHLQVVNNNHVFSHTLAEKLEFLFDNKYYDPSVWTQYGLRIVDGAIVEDDKYEEIKALYQYIYSFKHRFESYMGALKFYSQYAMKSFDGSKWMERLEERVAANALLLGRGDITEARRIAEEIITGRLQPATPTFSNAGKAQRGEYVSCFEGHMPVDTASGAVPIRDIESGDIVLTHDGTYQSVTGVMTRTESEGIVSLDIVGHPLGLSATSEHPVLAMRGRNNKDTGVAISGDGDSENLKWVPISDLKPGDYVVSSHYSGISEEESIRVSDYISLDNQAWGRSLIIDDEDRLVLGTIDKKHNRKKGGDTSLRRSPISNTILLDNDFGRFIGYYLSEGYVHYTKTPKGVRECKGIRFTFGSTETDYINDVVSLAEKIFGVTAVVNPSKVDGSTSVAVWSKAVGEFIHNLVGSGFDKKILPNVLAEASDEFILGALVGAFRGDGCTVYNGIILDMSNPALISQLRSLGLRVGLTGYVRNYTSQSGSPTSSLRVSSITQKNREFVKMVDKDYYKFKQSSKDDSLRHAGVVDGHHVYKIRGVSFEEKEVEVYNLEVENNHTYSVNGIVVHNCFLLDQIGDDMESISRSFTNALQLSKRGGGVGLNLSNIREYGAPIKQIEGQSSGVVPVMKILEDSFSYANQLGQRQGAGAIYLNAHHPDIERFLDTKRENADEKIRIKTLSVGIVIPDITFQLASKNEDMYLFSPYDVERVYGKQFSQISVTEKYYEMLDNPEIRKTKWNARKFFTTVAELQFESGYPYLMFEDTVNSANPIEGRISMSNLCSEILQVSEASTFKESGEYDHIGKDISCNLASINIVKALDGGNLEHTIGTAVRALSAVSDLSDIEAVPSIKRGNNSSRAIGLGQMNLHGFLIREGITYGYEDALNFTNNYFMTVAYYAYKESNKLAAETGSPFEGFERSQYADKGYLTEKYSAEGMINHSEKTLEIFEKYNVPVITLDDWKYLAEDIELFGLYNAYLQAIAPTGSISYVNYSTSSIHPIVDKMETRKEAMVGRVYYPQPFVTNENFDEIEDAYEIGYERLIDTYAAATKHVDQGMSLTLFLRNEHTTRDLNKAYIYAWTRRIKTIYYVRVKSDSIGGADAVECVSCQI